MKVRAIFETCRNEYLDDTADVNDDWSVDDTGYLWKNKELLRYLNEAKKQICHRRAPIRDDNSAVCSIAITGDSVNFQELAFSNRIIKIREAKLASQSYPLEGVWSINFLNREYVNWRDENGIPEMITQDLRDGYLTLIGIVGTDDTLNLVVDRIPLEDEIFPEIPWAALTEVADELYRVPTVGNTHYYQSGGGTSGASEPTWPIDGSTVVDGTITWTDMGILGDVEIAEINPQYQAFLLYHMAELAFLKRDSEANNLQSSEMFGRKFDRAVGPAKTVRMMEEDKRIGSARRRATHNEYR